MGLLRVLSTYLYIASIMRAESLFERLIHDAANWRDLIPLAQKVAGQVKVIFQNPRRYPREAVVIIAAVLLSFIMILLLVLLFFAIKRQYMIYRASRRVGKKIPREELVRRAVIAGSLLAVLIAGLTVATSQPSLCGRCHAIEKSRAQWEKSVHKDIGCLSCHHKPGVFGYVEGNITGAENLIASVFKSGDMPRATVTNGTCLKCHNDIFDRIVIGEREIKVQHKDLITGGLSCTGCHPDIAHAPKRIKTFAMNACISCHNGKTASAECNTCHRQDIGYKPSRTLDDWPKVKGSKLTCTGCHKQTTTDGCIRCHGLVLPHSEEFKQKHAMESERVQGKLCYKCHWERMGEKRMCGCHQDEGEIHGAPEAWYFEHRTVARTNGAGCNCHGKSFCTRCHDDVDAVYPFGYAGGSGEAMHGGWHTGMH